MTVRKTVRTNKPPRGTNKNRKNRRKSPGRASKKRTPPKRKPGSKVERTASIGITVGLTTYGPFRFSRGEYELRINTGRDRFALKYLGPLQKSIMKQRVLIQVYVGRKQLFSSTSFRVGGEYQLRINPRRRQINVRTLSVKTKHSKMRQHAKQHQLSTPRRFRRPDPTWQMMQLREDEELRALAPQFASRHSQGEAYRDKRAYLNRLAREEVDLSLAMMHF